MIEKTLNFFFQTAIIHFGRGRAHLLRVPIEAENQALSAGIGGIGALPRPERVTAT